MAERVGLAETDVGSAVGKRVGPTVVGLNDGVGVGLLLTDGLALVVGPAETEGRAVGLRVGLLVGRPGRGVGRNVVGRMVA